MRAVIMAGGQGTRLYPISLRRPKPMVNLFSKPVMEHILLLLRKHGIRDITATLQYMPKSIISYFEENPIPGIDLRFSVETEPLGTAGSVGLCREHICGEDVLVLSGDAVTDIDLTKLIKCHRDTGAAATLALYKHASPLEYGLVMTEDSGKISRFIEKPSWKQVFCDTVNTGIYLLKPEVLKRIPRDRPSDFAKDIFPSMLEDGLPIYGAAVSGYWCDMGDAKAYLQCHKDALSGLISLPFHAPKRAPGVYSGQLLPAGARILPPVYIDEDVTIEKNAVIGPFAILLGQSFISNGARIKHSILEGAFLGRGAEMNGAIALKGSVIHRGAILSEGAVVGENAEIGGEAVIDEGVRLWPGVRVVECARITKSIASGTGRSGFIFSDSGAISGELNGDITPVGLISLGAACRKAFQSAAVSGDTGTGRVLAESFALGFSGAGGRAVICDSETFAENIFAAKRCGLAVSVYIEASEKQVLIRFAGEDGLPISRNAERAIEGAAGRGDIPPLATDGGGLPSRITGIGDAYRRSLRACAGDGIPIFVDTGNHSGRTLKYVLSRAGFETMKRPSGVPGFKVSCDGTKVHITCEEGRDIQRDRIICMLMLCELLKGKRKIALPGDAPAAAEEFALNNGAEVFRYGRDAEAEGLYADAGYYRDGCAAALVVLSAAVSLSTSIAELERSVPSFVRKGVEIPLQSDRGRVMRSLIEAYGEAGGKELSDGARFSVQGGWVSVVPLAARPAIRVLSEGQNEETAEELLAEIKRRTIKFDRAAL